MKAFRIIFILFITITFSFVSDAQVLLDNFNRANSAIVGGTWTEVENYGSSNGAGALINANTLQLRNCTSGGGVTGRTFVYTNMASNYSTTFSSNPCMMTWAFNMSQNNVSWNGFNLGKFGAAFILGSNNSDFENAGNGYALVLGGSLPAATNKLRLVKFSGGIGNDLNLTDLITPITLATPLTGHYSYIVNYNPSGNKWQIFYRYDGNVFVDPSPLSGTASYTGSVTGVDNSYTGSSLPFIGGYWNFNSTPINRNALMDNIYIPASAPVITPSGATTFCVGGSVNLTSTIGSSYLWSNGSTTQTIAVNSTGSYSVIVGDLYGCTRTSPVPISVTVNALPAATITPSGPTTFCAGSAVNLAAPIAAGNSYLWSTGATTQNINISTTGNYTVKVTNAAGCQTTSPATVVTVNASPAVPTITAGGATTFCTGGSVNLTSSVATSYLWSNGATTRIITVNTSGNYIVTVKNANGCQNISAAKVVTVNPVPAVPVITAGGPTTFCSGGSVSLSVPTVAGNTYQWLLNAGNIAGATTSSYVAAAAGNYSVKVTNGSACSSTSASTTVTVNALPAVPTITASGVTTFCTGGSVNLTSVLANSYLWSNGASTRTITVTTSGSYTVTVTNAKGCQRTSVTTVVTVNAVPAVPVITAGGPTTFCSGGSVVLTSPVATSYLWSNGATTQAITVLATGNYTVKVTNAGGCSKTSAATSVTVNALPAVPTITAGGPTTFCAGGSVNLTSTVATSYLWSNGATTRTINVTTAGNYTVTVSNANSCQRISAVKAVVVNALPVATITASGSTSLCTGGSVTLTSSSGTAYLWSTGATTAAITVSVAGNYTVRVTNASGCQKTSAITSVTVNPLPAVPTITAGGPTTFCAGGSVVLTSTASTSYLWSNGATTQSITATTAGNYTVKITNVNGCQRTSAITTIIVNALPAVPTISAGGPLTFNSPGSVTLTSSTATSYLWSNGATTQAIVVNTSGSYTVTVKNASGCQKTSAATVVTVNTLPATPTISASGPTTFCAGGSVNLTANSSTAVSYLWSNGAITQTIAISTAGSYTVTITDGNNNQATSVATFVTVNALPAVPTVSASGTTSFCAGGSVNLTSSSASANLWSNGTSTQTINVSSSGSYKVTVTGANGCQATSAATAVTVNTLPVVSISAGGSTNFCAGGSVNLASTAGSSYLWSNGATAQNVNVTTSGSYSVTMTDANGCSGTSSATTVTSNSLPAVPAVISSGATTFCSGNSVDLTSASAASYLWSNGSTGQAITITSSGSYSVTITDVNNCSNTSAVTAVTVNPLPTAVITASGATTLCGGGTVTLTSSPNVSYLWSDGTTAQTIIANTNGSYSVTVTDANGCQNTSAVTSVTVNSLPSAVVSAGGATTFCAGGSVDLTSSSAVSYLWSDGITTSQTLTVTSSGSYSVTVTDANGCQNTSAVTVVTVNPLPAIPVITSGGTTTLCAGGSVNLTSSSPTSNLWSDGTATQLNTVSNSGTYTVTVSSVNGCQSTSAAVNVTVNSAPSIPVITTSGTTNFCTGGSVDLSSSVASAYLWSNGDTTQVSNVGVSGSYSVTISDINGCQSTSSPINVTVYSLPNATISASGLTTFCAGGSVTLSVPAASTYLWSDGSITSSVSVNSTGLYSVFITDVNGCQNTSIVTAVTVNTIPAVPVITVGGSTIFCSGGSVNLTSSASSSNLWSNGASLQTISVTASGSYTVTFTAANGCQATSAPVSVSVNSLPVPVITSSGPTTFCSGGSVNLSTASFSSYLWSNGASTQTISGINLSGAYYVIVTDPNGCDGTSSTVNIIVNSLPVPTVTANGPLAICSGSSVNLSTAAATSYLWSNGASTQTITASSAGAYTVSVTDANGCQATSVPSNVTIVSCSFTWTGGSNNTVWNTAGNWDKGSVPTVLDDVTIPSGPINMPAITGIISYHTISINSGATFTLGLGTVVNITGDFINNGSFTDNGGTLVFSGSSIQNITGTVNFKNVTVNNAAGVTLNNPVTILGTLSLINGQLVSNGNLTMDLNNGSIAYSATDNGSITGGVIVTKNIAATKSHYTSSPLNGSTTGDYFDDAQIINPATGLTRLFSWDVPTQKWIGIYSSTNSLNPLNGYSAWWPAAGALDFSGTYAHKSVPGTLNYTSLPATSYILVGNPYPSTLDWTIVSGWVKTNINNAIYFWDAQNGRYASYVNGAGINGGTKYIPSMQAFYVTSAAVGTVNVGINNNARVNSPNPAMWREAAPSNTLKLSLSSASYNDETIIRFDENASDDFDGNLDALKLKNPELAPSFYTVSGNHEYSINTLSLHANKTIPLNIETGFSGTYTISQEEVAGFDADYTLVLEDKLLNTYTDLKTKDYTFSVNQGQGTNRFNLVYRTAEQQANQTTGNASVNIFGNGNTVTITNLNLSSAEATYSLYNSIGQLIRTVNFNTASGQFSDQLNNITTGIYIVKVIEGSNVYSSKVFLSE